MSNREIVHPERFQLVLQELTNEQEDSDNNNASDNDGEEYIEESDHLTDSEIDFNEVHEEDTDDSPDNDPENNESNYFIKTIYKTKTVKGRKIKEVSEIHKWKETPYKSKFSKISRKNILRNVGPFSKNCDDVNDELSAFSKIINTDMIDIIVKYTNLYIRRLRPEAFAGNNKQNISETTRDEMMAFIGILYLLWIKKMSKVNIWEAWASDGTIEILQGIMGINRFKFLISFIRFDDKSTRNERKKIDKLAPVREFFDLFVQNCKQFYTPSEELTIDEKLEPYRGRCSFFQYIPSKPAKYGLKIFTLTDSKTFYTLNLEIYCGTQPEGLYLVRNSAIDIVDRLISSWKGTNRNLTTDNWYTSLPLAKFLLNNGITLVGTLRSNKKEIPLEFLPSKIR
nr:piggyBac transposable element-derived protein 4-like [Onthophagus taurus]